MMGGKNGKDLVEIIKQKTTPELVKKAYDSLKKLSGISGILPKSSFVLISVGENFRSLQNRWYILLLL